MGVLRDRSKDSLLTLIGDLPELITNLIKAEIEAAKAWARRTAGDAGMGSLWFVIALFFLFWAIPVILVFAIAGIASWWPVWLSALAVFGLLIVVTAIFVLMGVHRFRVLLARKNPVQAVAEDIRFVKDPDHDNA